MHHYLPTLTNKLLDGIEQLPKPWRERHGRWIRANQNSDGGFSGRDGGSDLYYTGFALRGLAVLNEWTPTVTKKAAKYLQGQLTGSASVIDLFSLLVSCSLVELGGGGSVLSNAPPDWRDRVGQTLESCRTPDGGYAKNPGAQAGSTYHAFLVALTYDLLEAEIPNTDRLIQFIRGRHRDDGGFVEVDPMRRSGANPTAAGLGTLQVLDALDADTKQGVVDFLLKLPSELEGGFRANDRIPGADVLSTFTALWTLEQLGAIQQADRPAIRAYVEACEAAQGGFTGGLWDKVADVEYTFYGLGVMSLLHDIPSESMPEGLR
jgi:geranylgeranyl transferase type-2 subunit beta